MLGTFKIPTFGKIQISQKHSTKPGNQTPFHLKAVCNKTTYAVDTTSSRQVQNGRKAAVPKNNTEDNGARRHGLTEPE